MNDKIFSFNKKLFWVLVSVILTHAYCIAQDSEDTFPDTLLVKLAKEKHVKSIKEIDVQNTKQYLLQTRWFNDLGLEVITQNEGNKHTYVQIYNKESVVKRIIYSTINLADTAKANDIYIHWFDSLGQSVKTEQVINDTLLLVTSNTYTYKDNISYTKEIDHLYGRGISEIKITFTDNFRIISYIDYNSDTLIEKQRSYYSKYNQLNQLTEQGKLNYEKGFEEFIDNFKGDQNNLLAFFMFAKDSLARLELSGLIKPQFITDKKYFYTNGKLTLIEEEPLIKKYYSYNAFGLPKEVLIKSYDKTGELLSKILYLYNEKNLPIEVRVYDNTNKITSKRLYTYTF
ncbi:MAG: hypothetical protein ACEQSR_05405 [Candidatus Methylacidiphilales bacterium]